MPRLKYASDADRIHRNVVEDGNGCWNWQLCVQHNGYGKLSVPGRSGILAHRFSYEVLVGPIPEGLTLDHLCRNRVCVNPAHLEPVTCRENVLRGETIAATNSAKTHCAQGHPFDEANTYVGSRGKRVCRACRRESVRQAATRRAFRAAGIEVAA